MESIDKTLKTLVSSLWGGRDKDRAGDSEMHDEVGSSINTFHLADILAGPLGDQIQTSVAAFVSAVEKQVYKLCSASVSIALVKYTTSFGH